MRLIDLTGLTFGRLTVLGRVANRRNKAYWACRCKCGNPLETNGRQLRNGDTTSCGCWHREQSAELCRARETTHGGSRTKLYRIWACMRDRCSNPRAEAFKWYGGKGVFVCMEWQEFSAFREWAMAHGYKPGLSIDRLNSDAPYAPHNCEWVTRSENTHRMQMSKHV